MSLAQRSRIRRPGRLVGGAMAALCRIAAVAPAHAAINVDSKATSASVVNVTSLSCLHTVGSCE